MRITFRPIDKWPTESRRPRQFTSPFTAGFSSSIELLEREIKKLGGREVVIQLAITEADIRLDGWPYAGARAAYPGVIVAFDSKYGPLKYQTDVFPHWHDNLRSIALALEALRKVDRYGVTKRGEQYTGWRALPSGSMSRARAQTVIDSYGGVKNALKETHPDHGGSEAAFREIQEARRLLGEAA